MIVKYFAYHEYLEPTGSIYFMYFNSPPFETLCPMPFKKLNGEFWTESIDRSGNVNLICGIKAEHVDVVYG